MDMSIALPDAGAANAEIARLCQETWTEAAAKAGISLVGFDPAAPLAERIAWALVQGLDIGAILSRFSSKMQHSTPGQVCDCTEFAAWHGIYVPPEFVCVDEAVSGRKSRRDGLDRMKLILQHKLAGVLLVFKVSRLFRAAYKGYEFFQEEVADEGLRGISVTQGIDTKDARTWKGMTVLHGLADDLLLEAISDHVRSGLKQLFLSGYCVGGLTLGYRPMPVDGAPLTNRGLPRTMPQVREDVAVLIRQHYEWIRDGMSIREGLRRWVAAKGPYDPRSPLKRMSYPAYRRLLSNPRYTGRWAFGRHRNVWKRKLDYTQQVVQPDTEVVIRMCDELRIVDDELFFAVQRRLERLKTGPRARRSPDQVPNSGTSPKLHTPRPPKSRELWDSVTECFVCACCNVRFYYCGAQGNAMTCKNGGLCPCNSIVRRKEAVRAVCDKLGELLRQDAPLIEAVVARAVPIDAAGDESLRAELDSLERRIASLTNKITDLSDLAGQGTDEDRMTLKAKLQAAQVERADLRLEQTRFRRQLDRAVAAITPEKVREILSNLRQLLEDAAAGKLGPDVVYRAVGIFRQLTGSRIMVHVDKRKARKRTNVRGRFVPELIRTVQAEAGDLHQVSAVKSAEVEVWLRPPPKLDRLADRVYQLVDIERHSLREAAAVLKVEGVTPINSGIVWQARHRWYEMRGLEMPRKYPRKRPDDGQPGRASA
jgi:site-specific DNA recombinase